MGLEENSPEKNNEKKISLREKLLIGALWGMPFVSGVCLLIAFTHCVVFGRDSLLKRVVRCAALFAVVGIYGWAVSIVAVYTYGLLAILFSGLLGHDNGTAITVIAYIPFSIAAGYVLFRYAVAPLLKPVYSDPSYPKYSWRAMPFMYHHVKGVLNEA